MHRLDASEERRVGRFVVETAEIESDDGKLGVHPDGGAREAAAGVSAGACLARSSDARETA